MLDRSVTVPRSARIQPFSDTTTVIGSRRMIVYDDTEPLEKLKIYDARVEVPPHYDTFAEFQYSSLAQHEVFENSDIWRT